ncbi:single-stranded DNA-binding protein [Pseudonocardia alni]|uniref:single-stranded DNA-binding protein n=1 Tax=Pseudonocardia alni TaxID=33907 RepID=UPI00332ED691
MSLPNLSGTGRLTADPEIRYSGSGKAVATLSLAFNARKRDDSGNWVDGDTFYIRGTAFGRLAENAAESFRKGHEVVVSGRLKTDQWDDKNGGGKRSAPSLLLDSVGGSCGLDTVTVNRAERSGGFGDRRPAGTDQIQTGGADDPWGAQPANVGAGQSDEIPF